jgi:hypothetical protein
VNFGGFKLKVCNVLRKLLIQKVEKRMHDKKFRQICRYSEGRKIWDFIECVFFDE